MSISQPNKEDDLSMEVKIQDVAERLFMNKGFAQTSTTEIAREVGCNQALVHYYFRTKENLFLTVVRRKIHLFAAGFFARDTTDATFEERIRRKVEAHFDLLAQVPKFPLLMLTDMTANTERIALMKEAVGNIPRDVLAALDNDLRLEIEKGHIRPISARTLFMNILSLNAFFFMSLPLLSAVLNMDDAQKEQFIHQRKEEIIETVLRSLKP